MRVVPLLVARSCSPYSAENSPPAIAEDMVVDGRDWRSGQVSDASLIYKTPVLTG
jgi:hypothetical protein